MENKRESKQYEDGYSQDIFINPDLVADFMCPICLNVLRNPFTDNCQHMFCEPCLTRLKISKNICPLSRQPLQNCLPVPKQLKAFLDKQKVKCIHNEKGCKWTGELEQLEKHLDADCIIYDKTCLICDSKFASRNEFEEHLKQNATEHYQKIEQILQDKKSSKDISVLDQMLTGSVMTSIHQHPLRIILNSNFSWFCDSVTDAPNQICEMGHQAQSYEQRSYPKFKCIQSCNRTYCPKCVLKYLQ